MTPIESKGYKAAAKAIETTFGKQPIPVRGGGSIPICSLFEKHLGIKIIFMGFGLDSDNLHSPNEKYDLANFIKALKRFLIFINILLKNKCHLNTSSITFPTQPLGICMCNNPQTVAAISVM